MDWRTLLIILVKGVLQAWADEVDPEGRYDDDPKEAPQPRTAESPPKSEPPASPSEGWGPPSEPPPVTLIRIETDAGTTIAAASFVGDECFGVTKMERTRQPGESRRVRRKAKETPVEKAPRDPWMTSFAERANAAFERQQAEIRAARATREAPVETAAGVHEAPVETAKVAKESPPRARPRGDMLPFSSLSPATLMLLEVGEPTTCVLRAV